MRLHATLAIAVALVARSAQAFLIQMDFAGSVGEVADGNGQLSGLVAVGDPFNGRLVFDLNLADIEPSDVSWGRYPGPGTSLTATFGSLSEENEPFQVVLDVFNDQNVIGPNPALDDAFFASVRPPSGFGTYSTLSLNLGDQTASAFTTDALPSSLALEDFDFAQARLTCARAINSVCGSDFWSVAGEIDAVSFQVIPEPSTIVLLSSSLMALAAASSHRRTPRIPANTQS